MNNRIGLLIAVSVIALLALSGVQAYLINNTYKLEKDAFINETNDAVSEIRNSPKMDSLQIAWRETLTNLVFSYRNNELSKTQFLERLITEADSLDPFYTHHYQKRLQAANLGYDVKFKKNLTDVIILDGLSTDTLFGARKGETIKLFGENFKEEDAFTSHVSTWYSEEFRPVTDTTAKPDLNLKFKVASQDLILIEDRVSILFGRLAGVFVISILIFLFVVGLLFFSIKNLITQKNIAEIKTDFVNNITHEFKTPLATLGIATKSLNKKEIVDSPDALENTLKIVNRQNSRLQKLLDEVMNNSLSSKEIVLQKEQVPDKNYFINLLEDFKISTFQDVTIKAEIQPSEVILKIDKFHFTTALRNILENAIKYNKGTPEISFKTKLNSTSYVITICDNGSGILKRDQAQIFNKFYRINSGNLHNVKGMGLGLYYANQIIKAHKGTISVQSDLDKGSCFTIKIPLV